MKSIIIVYVGFLLIFSCTPNRKDSSDSKDSISYVEKDTAKKATIVQNDLVKRDSTVPFLISASELGEKEVWKGDFSEAWRWYDKNGKNSLVLSSDKSVVHEEEDVSSSNLYARQYTTAAENKQPILLWEMHDFQNDCLFDLTAEFISSPTILDADSNGIKESYLLYKLSCRSDASPAKMKIIVHEGKKKYALRGMMSLKVNGYDDSLYSDDREADRLKMSVDPSSYMAEWGRFESADEFKNASSAIFETTKQLWKENRVEE